MIIWFVCLLACKSLVSLDSLYGTWPGLSELKHWITLPKVVSDRLMLLLSVKATPESLDMPAKWTVV